MKLVEAGHAEQARAPLEEARTLAQEAGDVATAAEATRGLGLVLQAAKDLVGARAHFEEALEKYSFLHDLRGMADTHRSLGLLAYRQGDWKEGHKSFAAAADEYGAAGDPGHQAQTLRSLTFDREMSDAEAIEFLRRAWELAAPLGDPRTEGLILHQWGDRLASLGDYGASLEKLEAASPLLDRGGTPQEASYLATSLGRTYRVHGLPEKALTYQMKALALSEQSGDQRAIAQALGAVAVTYRAMGRYPEALAFATRSLAARRDLGEPLQIMSAVGQRADILIEMGRYADAIALVRPVLPAEQTKGDEAYLYVALERAYAGLGRFDEAAHAGDQAIAAAEDDDRRVELSWALEHRGRLRLSRHDAPGALADARRALALIERTRATLAPRDFLKQGYGDTDLELFTLAIDASVSLKDAAGALVTAEQARARAFQDLLAAREQAPSGPSTASGEGPASNAAVEAPTLEDLKAVVARLKSTLLAYWVAPHETFIWVVTVSGRVEVRRVQVEATRLETLARLASTGPAGTVSRLGVELATSAPKTAPGASASSGGELRELYDLLVKPVDAVLRSEPTVRLTVIPRGPLFRVSFASLRDEGGRYFIERYELHYAPAVGVLRFTEKNVRGGGVKSALFVADPEVTGPILDERLLPLPGARLEVADAARQIGARSETLLGPQATEGRVRELMAGRDLLHFATHAVVSDRDPLGSYLALASSGPAPPADGRLTASEIYRLDISPQLVVLSACQSGAGKVTGDGIIGLTRGFFYAGSPSVIATLWDVADEPARYLMGRFYAAWRKGGTKVAALRAAQLDLIRALRAGEITAQTPFGAIALHEHAALWAAFVLLGEP